MVPPNLIACGGQSSGGEEWRMKLGAVPSLQALGQNLPETDLVGGLLSLCIETVKFVTGDLYNKNEFYWLINGP